MTEMSNQEQLEHTDIGTLIDLTISAVENKDAIALRRVSAQANSEAAIEGHREMILLALVNYALSKILSKVHYTNVGEKFYQKVIKHLKNAKSGSKEEMIKELESIEDMVIKLDKVEGNYEQDLIQKAMVKKAAKLYEQGLSLRRASELTGADPAEVLNFVGGSKMHEFKGEGKNAKRLKVAREVFK